MTINNSMFTSCATFLDQNSRKQKMNLQNAQLNYVTCTPVPATSSTKNMGGFRETFKIK